MLRGFKSLKKVKPPKKPSRPNEPNGKDEKSLDRNLTVNLSLLKNTFGKTDDVKYREFDTFYHQPIKVFICFLDGIVNENYINVNIMKPLLEPNFANNHAGVESLLQVVKNRIIPTLTIQELTDMEKVVESILIGETVLFIDGFETALAFSTQGFESRNVSEPDTESSVRGSREGFNEVLKVNTALIRRKINNPKLKFENMMLGKQTKTNIRLAYIEGIADSKVVEEVR